MGKIFYTERDLEDMVARGERKLFLDENVILTDLAYEKAKKFNVEIIQEHDNPPAAPIRPYLNQTKPINIKDISASEYSTKLKMLKDQVKKSVNTRLGNKVDEELLENIINRVLQYTPFTK